MVEMRQMQKLTAFVNAMILGLVVMMTGVFAHHGVTYMVYHSIPTALAYVGMFYLIYIKRLDLYVSFVYLVITIYMVATTVCLGYNAGFHYYCASLIPLSFYMQYLGKKLGTPYWNPVPLSLALVVVYLACTGYATLKGPVYQVDTRAIFFFMHGNALAVFSFLIGYSSLMQKAISESEEKLASMAHLDRLTGLFNRHYMIDHLGKLMDSVTPDHWIAMADIDDFKHINDHYGHNCGDYVLITLSDIMRKVCKDCVVARWGGEEFLITSSGAALDAHLLNELQQTVARTDFVYQDQKIDVTITVGASYYEAEQSLDAWIQNADSKLYTGKNSGKNLVVY